MGLNAVSVRQNAPERATRRGDGPLIAALAGGSTEQEAARVAGISVRTVQRRLADPTFARLVTEARAAMVSQSVGLLAKGAAAATTTLFALLQPAVSPSVRLGAARAILELGAKLREGAELEARIAALEAVQPQQRGRFGT